MSMEPTRGVSPSSSPSISSSRVVLGSTTIVLEAKKSGKTFSNCVFRLAKCFNEIVLLPTRPPQLLYWLYPSLVWKGKKTENSVYLTFDDGPHEKASEILDILLKYNTKATFFCIGKQIEKHPEILKRILSEGHIIGNHSYSHSKWNGFFSTQKKVSEIEQTNTLVSKLSNKKI